jgi:hypothetical protein
VQALIDYIEGGHSLKEFLDDFPSVTRELAVAALEQAKAHLTETEKIDEVLQLLAGQFVWSVRSGVDTFLTMEFGEPHRIVREPSRTAGESESAVVRNVLDRRRISIKGDFTLFVRDSQWSISTKDAAVNWKSDQALVRQMISVHLDGQKLVTWARQADETVLEFDLGTTLRLGRSMFPNDMASVLWTIKRWGGLGVGLLNSGAEFPIGKDGKSNPNIRPSDTD